MRRLGISPGGQEALRREVAAVLGTTEEALEKRLRPFVEASPEVWEREFSADPKGAVGASMVLALGAIEGLVRPRLLECYDTTSCYVHLRDELVRRFPDQALELEVLLRELFCDVPRLVDPYEALRLLHVAYEGHPPSSFVSLLQGLGVTTLVSRGGVSIDPVAAAARVVADQGVSYALELLEAGLLPPVITALAFGRRGRRGRRAVVEPVRVIAGMAAEAGALFVHGAPARPKSWEATAHVHPHCSRLARVLGLAGPPTLVPPPELLGLVRLDEETARAYDRALLDDAEEWAEEWLEADRYAEGEARRRASARVMTGFGPFCEYLRRSASRGAPILALPSGIAVPRSGTTTYEGIREDLCPRPEVHRLLLARAPELLEGEDDARLIILQLVTGARSSVVLGLDRSCYVVVPEGVVLHVPAAANKTGRTLLAIAQCWVDLYGITREWLPQHAPEDPPQHRRDELAAAIEQLCRRFEAETGHVIARKSARFTRSACAQLLRPHLRGLDREAMTAFLGHHSRVTRSNYWRAYPEEIIQSLGRFGLGGRPGT